MMSIINKILYRCIKNVLVDVLYQMYKFFFFSSRRRHTSWTGDWSSDVCSSDLFSLVAYRPVSFCTGVVTNSRPVGAGAVPPACEGMGMMPYGKPVFLALAKIGRASCRERVYITQDDEYHK